MVSVAAKLEPEIRIFKPIRAAKTSSNAQGDTHAHRTKPGVTNSRDTPPILAVEPWVKDVTLVVTRGSLSAGRSAELSRSGCGGPCMFRAARVSALHRLLGLAPGQAPMWLCSRDSCTALDLLGRVVAVSLLTAMVLGRSFGLRRGAHRS